VIEQYCDSVTDVQGFKVDKEYHPPTFAGSSTF
jgi:hypothetical protein